MPGTPDRPADVTGPATDERVLRDAVVRGDERAWGVLWDRYFDAVHAYVRWRIRESDDRTDEIVQECWMIAVRRIRKFDPALSTFGTWLRGIANNVIRNELRRRVHSPTTGLEDAADVATESAPACGSGDVHDAVSAVLHGLPEDYRRVLTAKYCDGLAVEEIAAISGRTPKAVESLLTRARDAFRRAWPRTETTP
jgi:RNA polymerase sigma-70 factor (ECF subfamily)